MKTVIMAGGAGSRIATDREIRPKPMIEIGGKPLVWHIMNHFEWYGYNQFVVALGYKGEMLKRYLIDYSTLEDDFVLHTVDGTIEHKGAARPDWHVHLADTGIETKTGGRLLRLRDHLTDTFMMTWGDSVSNVDIGALVDFHRSHGKLATLTIVRPVARYGHIVFDGDRVDEFAEKPQTAEGWINGAYCVLEPEVLDFIESEDEMWEHAPLQRLAAAGELKAFRHESFWRCCDTLRDKHQLDTLWQEGNAPWAIWNQTDQYANLNHHSNGRA